MHSLLLKCALRDPNISGEGVLSISANVTKMKVNKISGRILANAFKLI